MRFEFESHELEAARARALALKPRGVNIVATDRGWEVEGGRSPELLVSFAGLATLFGEVAVEAVEPVVEAPAPVVDTEPAKETEKPVEQVSETKKTRKKKADSAE